MKPHVWDHTVRVFNISGMGVYRENIGFGKSRLFPAFPAELSLAPSPGDIINQCFSMLTGGEDKTVTFMEF